MNSRKKKVIFASMIFVMDILHYLLGGSSALAACPHGHGPGGMESRGNFGTSTKTY